MIEIWFKMVKERLKELVRLAAIDNKVAEKEARFIQMIGQANGVEKGDVMGQISFINEIFGVVA